MKRYFLIKNSSFRARAGPELFLFRLYVHLSCFKFNEGKYNKKYDNLT
jgi:hypothetical protein